MLAGIEHGRVLLGVANWAERFLREYGNLREQRLAQLEDFDQATHLVQLLLGHVAGVLNGNLKKHVKFITNNSLIRKY